MKKKIHNIDDLKRIILTLKKKNKKVALCHGVFDLLHPGHIHHFEEAKKNSDILIVSITSDEKVIKGPGRPYFNKKLRMHSLASLECVDYVVSSEEKSAIDIIKNIKPDLYVKGKEYQKFDDVKKEPSNETHWISTSLGTRPHRIYMASLLKGMKLDRHGDLRIKTVSSSGKKSSLVSEELATGNGNAPDNTPTLPLYVKDKWKLSKEIENISEESSKGYQELIKRKWWGSSLFLYSHYLALGWNENNNALNFDKNLRHLYKDKTLEVVNETMHGYNPIFVTEKFINAVIGLNLVIMNGPAGTVKLLEDLGWNSCRHVVNHDYDDITDPIMRCEQAIRFNSKLFSDPAYCNKVWQENLNILHDNSKWARDHLYNQILKNCEQQFKEVA